jgi:hypothetical protein
MVSFRSADELDLTIEVEVVDAHAGSLAANCEQRLEVLPGHRAQHDTLIFLEAQRRHRDHRRDDSTQPSRT